MPSSTKLTPMRAKTEHYFDDAFVQRVRDRILEDLELCVERNNNDDDQSVLERCANSTVMMPYDPKDVGKLKHDDWFIRRFLAWKPTTVEEAAKTLHQCLIWRKQIKINSWTENTFPVEFYQIAACFSYLPDKEGHNMLILRLRFSKKDQTGFPCIENMARNYFIYVLEQIVDNNPNRGFGIIFDCNKASLSNVDLDMARFIINTLSNHYSGAISYVCIYELPWIFNQIWKLVRSWLDEEAKKIVKFATKSNICEIIDVEHLPDYMGGTGSKNYRHVPKGAPNMEELFASMGITSAKDVLKLNEHFQKLISMS